MIPVTDPFGIVAPDGHTYFKVLGPPLALSKTYEYMLAAIRNYRRASQLAPDPRQKAFNRGRAEMIERAVGRMRAELTALGTSGAIRAEDEARGRVRSTQVRPDPIHQGKRLQDLVVCRPIATSLPSGSIGIGDMKVLDQVPFWRAQEFGYVLPEPRIIPGYFQPGFSRPSQGEYRQHPMFEQMQYARGMPALNLPAGTRIALQRRYLRDTVSSVATWRLRKLGQVQKDAIVLLERAAGASPAGIGIAGRALRRPPRRRF